jgi:hypothetical protein
MLAATRDSYLLLHHDMQCVAVLALRAAGNHPSRRQCGASNDVVSAGPMEGLAIQPGLQGFRSVKHDCIQTPPDTFMSMFEGPRGVLATVSVRLMVLSKLD